jgi:hypothetical protein
MGIGTAFSRPGANPSSGEAGEQPLFLSPSGRGWIARQRETGEGLSPKLTSLAGVILAKVGTQCHTCRRWCLSPWVPAFAGMTPVVGRGIEPLPIHHSIGWIRSHTDFSTAGTSASGTHSASSAARAVCWISAKPA